jgi:hypothetical protein
MIMTMPRPPTAPETCPTVRISSTGSFDLGAMVSMPKKKPAPAAIRIKPTINKRQFRFRMFPTKTKKLDYKRSVL